jgi:hypothetical protein
VYECITEATSAEWNKKRIKEKDQIRERQKTMHFYQTVYQPAAQLQPAA